MATHGTQSGSGGRDPHRFVNELDSAAVERLVQRLESRARDAVFLNLIEKYAGRMNPPPGARILEVGCGTGAMLRTLGQRAEFGGKLVGVDQCQRFVDLARDFARDAGLAGRLRFQTGDAHRLEFPGGTFDAAIAHTVISHVTDPIKVLREMTRVVRPGGLVVVFDGDYASLTFACPDHEFGLRMDSALATATFNNVRIMRDLPRIFREIGLTLTEGWGDAIAEIGTGSYFRSFAETYAPHVVAAGLEEAEQVEDWLCAQRSAMENGTFFAACNYYTYLAQVR